MQPINCWVGIFFLILTWTCAYGQIEDYLKKINDKSGEHRIRNIDCIYMINLDERPEKWRSCMEQLTLYGIQPYRFSAINGWRLSVESINELGVKYGPWMQGGQRGTFYLSQEPHYEYIYTIGRTYFGDRVFPGTIGIVLSHLSVMQDAYDSGYETIWVMEDDIEIIHNPHILSDLIDKLDSIVGKDGWDILFTDRDSKNSDGKTVPCSSFGYRPNFTPSNLERFAEKKAICPELRRIGARYGSYSMVIRRSGMRKLLNFIKKYQIFLPIDMDYTLPNDMRLFTVLEDVVSTQCQAPSDNSVQTINTHQNQ